MQASGEVYLIAQGEETADRWRRPLPQNTVITLGRSSGIWSVPWDQHISRQHAELLWDGQVLTVRRLSVARNPIFFQGEERDCFSVKPGEHFVIGRTRFTLTRQQIALASDHPTPTHREAFAPQHLRQVVFRNPNTRMEVLSRLPRAVSTAAGEPETAARLVNLLLAGMPNVEAVAIVAVAPASPAESAHSRPLGAHRASESHATAKPIAGTPDIQVLHWDRRLLTGGDFRPSRGLICEVWSKGQSVVHVWRMHPATTGQSAVVEKRSPAEQIRPTSSPTPATPALYTMEENIDWAICTPIRFEKNSWMIYAAGRFQRDIAAGDTTPDILREDVKFLELVAEMTSSLLQLRALERRQAVLAQFLPRPVVEQLTQEDPEKLLSPKEVDVTVLFCDLRGFSQETERHAEKLLPLLGRISAALEVMTHHILEQGGVIGDFQGDAAMGFWGWPIPQEDRVVRACRTALAIRKEFESAGRSEEGLLKGFQIGIGIASGRAVAGKIGTAEHAKVTVFGPPVNLASRLEGITKLLHVPILMDEATAQALRESRQYHNFRLRKLVKIRPYGLDQPVLVHELVPPVEDFPLLTDEHLRLCDEAVAAFLAGQWDRAYDLLHCLPTSDRGADFLTAYITRHYRQPPPGWDGTITLTGK